jgi:hypothetical protein
MITKEGDKVKVLDSLGSSDVSHNSHKESLA